MNSRYFRILVFSHPVVGLPIFIGVYMGLRYMYGHEKAHETLEEWIETTRSEQEALPA